MDKSSVAKDSAIDKYLHEHIRPTLSGSSLRSLRSSNRHDLSISRFDISASGIGFDLN